MLLAELHDSAVEVRKLLLRQGACERNRAAVFGAVRIPHEGRRTHGKNKGAKTTNKASVAPAMMMFRNFVDRLADIAFPLLPGAPYDLGVVISIFPVTKLPLAGISTARHAHAFDASIYAQGGPSSGEGRDLPSFGP